MRRLARFIAVVPLVAGGILGWAGSAAAGSGTVRFQAVCGETTLTLQTGVNASPLLTVVAFTPRVNAVIKDEQAFDSIGTLVYQHTVPGFTKNGQKTLSCVMTTTQAPYAGYTFDVTFLLTPAA
jgi:hypothetical protein